MRYQTIGTRLSNAKAHKLINTMAGNHAELNDETLNDTGGDKEAEVVVVTMADTPEEFEAEAPIQIPPDTFVKVDADTNEDIKIAALAAALVGRLDQKIPEVKAETLSRNLGVLKGQTTILDGGRDSTRGADQDTLPQ